ncbi:MAG: hypothetical protein M3O34_02765 [Chloroflexota bacterium]|nr:hypothetical protein [Chloroflexota bacterium]
MDDERRFRRLERPFFQRRELTPNEWRLGLLILGLVALGAWLIFWPLLPTIASNLVVGLIDLINSFGAPPPAPPAPALTPSPLPSPSPAAVR